MILATVQETLGLGCLCWLAILFAAMHSLKKSLSNVPAEGVARFCGAILGNFFRR